MITLAATRVRKLHEYVRHKQTEKQLRLRASAATGQEADVAPTPEETQLQAEKRERDNLEKFLRDGVTSFEIIPRNERETEAEYELRILRHQYVVISLAM